jgi:hypothetical protein
MLYMDLHTNALSLQMMPYIYAVLLEEGSTGTGDG